MATKQQVIDLNRQHPEWTAPRLARELNCTPSYVHATARRNGLVMPRSRGCQQTRDPEALAALIAFHKHKADIYQRRLNEVTK